MYAVPRQPPPNTHTHTLLLCHTTPWPRTHILSTLTHTISPIVIHIHSMQQEEITDEHHNVPNILRPHTHTHLYKIKTCQQNISGSCLNISPPPAVSPASCPPWPDTSRAIPSLAIRWWCCQYLSVSGVINFHCQQLFFLSFHGGIQRSQMLWPKNYIIYLHRFLFIDFLGGGVIFYMLNFTTVPTSIIATFIWLTLHVRFALMKQNKN